MFHQPFYRRHRRSTVASSLRRQRIVGCPPFAHPIVVRQYRHKRQKHLKPLRKMFFQLLQFCGVVPFHRVHHFPTGPPDPMGIRPPFSAFLRGYGGSVSLTQRCFPARVRVVWVRSKISSWIVPNLHFSWRVTACSSGHKGILRLRFRLRRYRWCPN